MTASEFNDFFFMLIYGFTLQFHPININIFTEYSTFTILDNFHATATGSDQLPAWFLRIGAPFFASAISHIFNLSLLQSFVPSQWKAAIICPIPKITNPVTPSDFRPISITPVLSRILEKVVVRQFIYPAILHNTSALIFNNQFAFRPTGSTTAALFAILADITNLLKVSPYVHMISLDFSKAFDTVRYTTLLEKLALLPLSDFVYNWLVNYFIGHSHCTRFKKYTIWTRKYKC